jgi:hypothetical protein
MSEYWVDSNHILHGPNVIVQLIPEAATQEKINPWSIILHSNAGPHKTRWQDLWSYVFRKDIGIEPHFIGPDSEGVIVQTIPLNVRADCNAKANAWSIKFGASTVRVGAVSFETQDNGAAALATTPYNPAQFNALVGAVAAIGHKYGNPYQSPATWDDRGVGYHCQYPEWSIYVGKTCPGAARIYQLDELRRQAAAVCAC